MRKVLFFAVLFICGESSFMLISMGIFGIKETELPLIATISCIIFGALQLLLAILLLFSRSFPNAISKETHTANNKKPKKPIPNTVKTKAIATDE